MTVSLTAVQIVKKAREISMMTEMMRSVDG